MTGGHVPFEQSFFKTDTAVESVEQSGGGGALSDRLGALFGRGSRDRGRTLIERVADCFQISD